MSTAASGIAPRLRPLEAPVPGAAELAEARATTQRVARTFAIACRLLPRAVRDDVYLLYMVFRTLDDLVDDSRPEAAAHVEAAAAWAAGRPGTRTREVAVLEALAVRHPLPRDAIADFCAGMRQDLAHETFDTEEELDRYCYRVAGTVGLVMTAILGARDPERARPAAAALGMAMQRTNILRDIDEDAAAGRVYIARESALRHGSLAPGRRADLLRDQIARADALYEQGLAGIAELRQGRRAIAVAGAMYREILREIERGGLGALPGRAVVSPGRKLVVAVQATRLA
ncbi:MAG TPA: phytoene/squalene synthase family protein [Solirubrobacteraceae bacterium]|jgi:phytoene synthase|nr:phytoene/squalene synthase family protein [Solirubrobacteraceae bacterium]